LALSKASQEHRSAEGMAESWLPPRDSNPDMLIQSQGRYGSCCFQQGDWLTCNLLSFLEFIAAQRTEIASVEQPA